MPENKFEIVYSVKTFYNLTPSDLEFLNDGQPVHVIPDKDSSLVLFPPKEDEE